MTSLCPDNLTVEVPSPCFLATMVLRLYILHDDWAIFVHICESTQSLPLFVPAVFAERNRMMLEYEHIPLISKPPMMPEKSYEKSWINKSYDAHGNVTSQPIYNASKSN